MSYLTGIIVIFSSIALAAVIPKSEKLDLPADTLNNETILAETESTGDVPISEYDIKLVDVPKNEDLAAYNNDKENNTTEESPNSHKIYLDQLELPLSDLNETEVTQNKNVIEDDKKIKVLNKIESTLKTANQSKFCNNYQPLSTPLGIPLDMVPIFKPRRYMPCKNKESDYANVAVINSSPNIITTDIQYSKPFCGYYNPENVICSDDINAILKTKSYPSFNCNNGDSKSINTGLSIDRNYNLGCNSNNHPLKVVQITKTQGGIDLNDVRPCEQNAVPTSNACNTNNAKIVIFKPEKLVVEESYGEFLKKRTMDVLIPYYVSQLPV